MVIVLDGNSEHGAQEWRKVGLFGELNLICDCSRWNQMPWADQI